MNWLQFVASIVGSAAWPLTVIVTIVLLRRRIGEALSRLATFKHGETEISFAAISRKVIEGASTTEEAKYKAFQVITETENFKLYANGLVTQRRIVQILPNSDRMQIPYPINFPNESALNNPISKRDEPW